MNGTPPRFILTAFLTLTSALPASAGIIFQNFEPNNGAPLVLTSIGGGAVQVVGRTETVHLGVQAVKASGVNDWTGFGVRSQVPGDSVDLKQSNNDRLTFWTYALPRSNCTMFGCVASNNTVSVTLYDQSAYQTQGFEVWTTQTASYGHWSKLKILFSQLPPGFDLRHVTRVEFKNYWPGSYYFDDIQAVREDRVYQAFEKEERSGSSDGEYGWKWNANDTVGTSASGEPAFEGNHSWKLISTAQWGGTGIQSQEKRYTETNGTVQQDFWHVDLDPDNNDRLTFWVYGLPDNGMDNNVQVQFYDHGAHSDDFTKVPVWTKTAAVAGRWTRLTALFSDVKKVAGDFNFHDISKIQLQCYWPGTYYFDDIRASGPQSQVLESAFARGMVEWKAVAGAANYRLQESLKGPEGPWKTIYSGPATSTRITRLSKSWLRVRWEEAFTDRNSLPYASGWSDIVEYLPPAVVFHYDNLAQGWLRWSAIPQAQNYEVQTAPARTGPWRLFHRGGVSFFPLRAQIGHWYRVRGINGSGGTITDVTAWSRPQRYTPGGDFIRAKGTVLRDDNGRGDPVVLAGVNLGGAFVIEPWMTGLGNGDTPALPDDWTIRKRMEERFGTHETGRLLRVYQEAYINSFDFDRLVDRGVTLVRLPFYYRNFQDDDGHWISGENSLSALDPVIDALADRGIYTVIDMHGAPGLQSAEATTGRAGFNRLFAPDGEVYRKRTEDLWRAIARRYRDNPWVLGYDLLNEPLGAAPQTELLANVYDRLYRAIRSVDPHHLIIMEGIWYADVVDWDTLPPPSHRRWTNVMYQFHFYHWNDIGPSGEILKSDENFASHKAFLDQKLAAAAVKQPEYDVPVMIGEFYGFSMKSIWDYYLNAFNARNWSWTSWSYKYHDSPSSWGLVAHSGYDEALPDFQNDSAADLRRKFGKYATADYHTPTVTLQETLQDRSLDLLGASIGPAPVIGSIAPQIVKPVQEITVSGWNFGATQNGSQLTLDGAPMMVLNWSDRSIRAILSTGVPPGARTIMVQTAQGTSNAADLIVSAVPPAPVLNASANGTFTLLGRELGDTPGTFQFYPSTPCGTMGMLPCNNGDAGISYWSEMLVNGTVPPDAADLTSRFNVRSQEGGDLYPTMLTP